jgi:hypothetical protein
MVTRRNPERGHGKPNTRRMKKMFQLSKEQMKSAIEENIDFLFDLYERWQDEKGHENYEDYRKAIESRLGFPVASTPKPFCFEFNDYYLMIFDDGGKIKLEILEVVKKG